MKSNTTKANHTRIKSKLNQTTHKMLNVNKRTETKPKPKLTLVFVSDIAIFVLKKGR